MYFLRGRVRGFWLGEEEGGEEEQEEGVRALRRHKGIEHNDVLTPLM